MWSSWLGGSRASYQPLPSRSDSSSEEETEQKNSSIAIGSSGSSSKGAMDKMKGMLGLGEAEPTAEKSFGQEFDEMMTLSRTQRFYGFAITFVIGWIISLLSLVAMPQIVTRPEKFALLYTAGNLLSLASTAFLWGPMQQIRDMFKPIRIVATIVYLLSMALTLFCAFGLKMLLPVIAALLVQMCAMVYYCLSYIPYGHTMLKSCLEGCCAGMLG